MSIWVKAGLATLGAGAIGGVGAYAGGLFESKTNIEKPISKTKYRDRLTKEGFDTNVTESEWTTILTAYNKVQDTKKTFKATNEEQETKEELIRKCNSLLDSEEENENNYKKAKRWCVKEETADAILKKENSKFRTLNRESADVGKSDWQGKIQKLTPINATSTKLGITAGATENANITAIKKQCGTLTETKTTAEEFEENFKLAKDWCSVPKVN